MNTGDIIRSILIFIVFMILTLAILSSSSKASLQEQWPNIRCNPLVLPVAGQIAPEGLDITTEDNFQYCTQSTMSSFAPNLLAPIEYVGSSMTGVLDGITDGMGTLQEGITYFQGLASSAGAGIFDSFFNITAELTYLLANILDLQQKMAGVNVTFLNILQSTGYTFLSTWNGPVGDLIKAKDPKN